MLSDERKAADANRDALQVFGNVLSVLGYLALAAGLLTFALGFTIQADDVSRSLMIGGGIAAVFGIVSRGAGLLLHAVANIDRSLSELRDIAEREAQQDR